MTEDDRFTWKTVHGWHTNAFLVVMNGLDKKNKRLKQEKEQLMQDWIRVFLSAKNEQRKLKEENEQLKQDVEYWKQVASQYSNELNVFEHNKKYKTECKDIYWSSD